MKTSPQIILDDEFITVKSLFKSDVYLWSNISEIYLSKKEPYKFLGTAVQIFEATSITFINGEKIILWDNMYSNVKEIRQFLYDKAYEKIKDPRSKLKNDSIKFITDKIYKGNPFTSFNTLVVIGAFIFILYLVIDGKNFSLTTNLVFLFPLFLYFIFGIQMHYFMIENENLIIKNHFFFWKTRTFPLNEIWETNFETPYRGSRSLRILTKDYDSKLFGAASLKNKDWKELRKDLSNIGIPVRSDS